MSTHRGMIVHEFTHSLGLSCLLVSSSSIIVWTTTHLAYIC